MNYFKNVCLHELISVFIAKDEYQTLNAIYLQCSLSSPIAAHLSKRTDLFKLRHIVRLKLTMTRGTGHTEMSFARLITHSKRDDA